MNGNEKKKVEKKKNDIILYTQINDRNALWKEKLGTTYDEFYRNTKTLNRAIHYVF